MLHEHGINEVDIARQTNHHIKSVGRYIKTYERVKKLEKIGMDGDEIVRVLRIGNRVAVEYRKIVERFYPEFNKKKTLKTTKSYKKSPRGQISQ
jgi:hypothetical protein